MEEEMETEGGRQFRGSSGSLRTRSQVAPDWTIDESLILVNEISAVEGDCQNTLSSFQKWKIVVENCNALEVNRSLNQCRRKWDSLLSDYKKIKQSKNIKDNFNPELFRAIESYVKARDGRCDSDPDSDPEACPDPLLISIAQSGSKKQQHRVIPHQRNIEGRLKPKRRIKSQPIEECSSEEKIERPTKDFDGRIKPEESNTEEKEQLMAAELRENVELINALVHGHLAGNTIDFTRDAGDKIIACLGNIAEMLDQLCALVQ